MRLTVEEREKLVAVWLTRAEQEDAALSAVLLARCAPYRRGGYTVAVFRSGGGELFPATRDLLLHNRASASLREREEGGSPLCYSYITKP